MIKKPHIYRRKITHTGKYYIGKHKGSNIKYKGSGVDYKKYVKNPKEDLEEEILEIVDDLDKLNLREEYWLKKYNVASNPLYYNKTNRGRGWSIVSEKQREKISKSKIGKPMSLESSDKKRKSMLGKPKHTEKSKNLIGNKNKGPNPKLSASLKGKPKTKEHKENLSKSKKGKPCFKNRKKILQYVSEDNLLKTYNDYESVIKQNPHFKIHNIYQCCNGRQKTSYGYIWKYE